VTIGTVLGGLLDDFSRLHPEISFEAAVDNTRIIEALLLEDKADLGFVEGLVRSRELVTIPFMDDELVLVLPSVHPLAGRGAIEAADLEGESFVIREEGSGTRDLFESVMAAAGLFLGAPGVATSGNDQVRRLPRDGHHRHSRLTVTKKSKRGPRSGSGAGTQLQTEVQHRPSQK
jgi:DNA-binding transcriptional LysR family regulator